jgi:hypothetical protein
MLTKALKLWAVHGIWANATAVNQVLRFLAFHDVVVSYAIDWVNFVIGYQSPGAGETVIEGFNLCNRG